MTILYLYAELMGYQIPVFKEYVKSYNAEVHVVHWNHKKITPYVPPILENVSYYNRSEYDKTSLITLAQQLKPNIIYVSGWMDKEYMMVCYELKKNGIPIVAGCDTMWRGDLRQKLGRFYFKFFLKKNFSFIWVAGPYQYEYAKRLGFINSEIIFHSLTANNYLFNYDEEKFTKTNKKFLYVGNFKKIKGTDILIKAFELYQKKYQGKWGLTCYGNGELQYLLEDKHNVEIKPFSSQEDLAVSTKNYGAFILPSRLDQWGVVLHEFSLQGLPLLSSDKVGARATFLIDNFNGYTFKNEDFEDLANKMYQLEKTDYNTLKKFKKNSNVLGHRVTVDIVAGSFMSAILNNKK